MRGYKIKKSTDYELFLKAPTEIVKCYLST